MTVGKMMDHLAHGPTAGAIGRLQLAFVQTLDRLAKSRWRLSNLADVGIALFARYALRPLKPADRITKIHLPIVYCKAAEGSSSVLFHSNR
jgi:hypothetical protein